MIRDVVHERATGARVIRTRFVGTLCVMYVGVIGCARPAPTPTVRAPTAAPTPATALPTASVRYTVPMLVADTRYRVESVAGIERDSAGRKESLRQTSGARVTVRLRRSQNGAFEGTGRVDAYSLRTDGVPTAVLTDSVRFDAILDAQSLRIVLHPALVNECDRPEAGPLAIARELLLRLPASIAVGETWRDSTTHVVCRALVPLTVRTVSTYSVTGVSGDANGDVVQVHRASVVRVDGKLASPWRTVDIGGGGTATLDATVSTTSGAVLQMSSGSVLTLVVTDRSSPAAVRTQQVTQRVTTTANAVQN